MKLHYVLTQRTDSKFWMDNKRPESIPRSLRVGLEYWAHHCPWHEDFAHREEVFSAASYQYILYGMGFETAMPRALLSDADRAKAREKMHETARHGREVSASLPLNRELLSKVRRYGLQKI